MNWRPRSDSPEGRRNLNIMSPSYRERRDGTSGALRSFRTVRSVDFLCRQRRQVFHKRADLNPSTVNTDLNHGHFTKVESFHGFKLGMGGKKSAILTTWQLILFDESNRNVGIPAGEWER